MKATLNRCVFRTDLTFSRDDAFLIFAGNLFHKVGATTLNTQSPYDLSRNTGTCNSIWLDDLSFRDDFLMDTSPHSYSGAISLIKLILLICTFNQSFDSNPLTVCCSIINYGKVVQILGAYGDKYLFKTENNSSMHAL